METPPACKLAVIRDEHSDQATGGFSFLGFFASLFLRCCPLAMIVLLVVSI
jgi:hypothetical protein